MSPLLTWLCTLAGLALIVVALRDIVHELFNPESTGSMSRAIMRGMWAVMRAIAKRIPGTLYMAGPLMILLVAAVWATMLTVGWALIYWPRLHTSFIADRQLPIGSTDGFWTAMYLSLTSLSTLGAGAFTPIGRMMRLVVGSEAVVGVGMITAWITWVLSVLPVIASRRSLARELFLLRKLGDEGSRLESIPAGSLAEHMRSITESTIKVHCELAQTPVTYYFHARSPNNALLSQIPYVLELTDSAQQSSDDAVRHHARLLRMAVDDLISSLGVEMLDAAPHQSTDRMLHDLSRDQMRAPPRRQKRRGRTTRT